MDISLNDVFEWGKIHGIFVDVDTGYLSHKNEKCYDVYEKDENGSYIMYGTLTEIRYFLNGIERGSKK